MTAGSAPGTWSALAEGNARFAAGRAEHPHQDPDRRAELATGQAPRAVVLGCSDSRVGPETVLDQGLGDLFVVRNAGHVVDDAAVASIEYGVDVLGARLVVVLAHERCGAVRAAVEAEAPDAPPLPPRIAAHVARIRPAVLAVPDGDPEAVGAAHLEASVAGLLAASESLSAQVADGSVTVVGARYRLADGRVERRFAVGDAS